jgi:H+-transporting ATPase
MSQHKVNREGPKEMKSPGEARELTKASLSELKQRLEYSPDGLSEDQAKSRLLEYGYNEISERKVNPVLKFLSYFWGPIPGMIIVAAILSAILRHWSDLGVILALLLLNAVVGFREEYQAGNAIAALKARLPLKARVKRGGKWTTVAARDLVPGDIARLRIGDIVPGDARILEGDPVEVDQSSLTGESLPVERKSGEAIFSGSILRQGECDALVYATGANTYYGKTAELVKSAKVKSHFQRALLKIADYLIVIAVVLAVVIFMVAIFRGDSPVSVLQFALVLTVAAVPVAMPAVLSVTMALGAQVLARKQAIVTRLSAVEELAGVDILCSDKTGTLTQNKLTMGDPFVMDGVARDVLILTAALASRSEDQDPIDLAILGGLENVQLLEAHHVEHFQPFDPVHKRTEATVKDEQGATFKTTKGAPQVILALDPRASEIHDRVEQAVNGFAARGFRSLGVARTNDKDEWRFLGVIPLYDPLREDSKSTVKTAREMGIEIKMVTGDQIAIAREIADQLELGKDILDASVFGETGHHEAGRLGDAIEKANGFAQVFPEHKYHIVDVLQQRGHIVGMTGDGVNDAPALKKADAGIAVAGSTDAARTAADIALLSPGLSVIIDAVKEARKTFQRMSNYAIYRIAETVALLGFLTLSILAFDFQPVTAIMIVLLAILNDGAILSIAYDNVRYSGRPEAWNMRLVLGVATIIGTFAMVRSFGIFYLADSVFNLDRNMIQTMIYLTLSVGGHLTVFAARTRGPFWSIRPAPILLVAVIGTQIAATLIAGFGVLMTALPWQWVALVWGYTVGVFFIQDRVKLMAYDIFGQGHSGLLARESKA